MLLIPFLSLVQCKWPREKKKTQKPKLDFHNFPLAETASSSYSETVSAGREVAAACQHCTCCQYYYYFLNVNPGDPNAPAPHSIIMQPPDGAFFMTRPECWHLAAIQRRAVNLDLTPLIILPAAWPAYVSLVMLLGEMRNRDFSLGFWRFTKTQLSWERP